ncbi:hypothetical protein [Glaciecola sp. SC05]|uniref:hypothetical protein n=1 Tax=Glaciecola sp. SC05 TaxID=1987355 RepID=UPI0035285FD6
MILRRLTQHIKEQNWFAVCLDFVIVIFGILIAFQITNWSAARQDNLIYEQARTRVIEEARANLLNSQSFLKRASDYQQAAIEVIRDFEACNEENGAQARLIRNIQPLRFILGIDVRDDAIDLMLTSDAFLDNISPEDRSIFSVYAENISTVATNSKFGESFSLTRPQLQDIDVFRRIIDGDGLSGLAALSLNVSYEEACNNSALSSLIFDRFELSNYLSKNAKDLSRASRELLIKLGETPPEASLLETQP